MSIVTLCRCEGPKVDTAASGQWRCDSTSSLPGAPDRNVHAA